MEKLFKSRPQFFLLLLMFMPLKSFSEMIYANKSLFFNSTTEAEAYYVQSTGWWCCGVTQGEDVGGKRFIRYVGKTTLDAPPPYTTTSSTDYIWGQVHSCPTNSKMNQDSGQCTSYVLGAPRSSPVPKACVGNPVDVMTGAKMQTEMDIPAIRDNQVFFERYYNNLTSGYTWNHNYSKSLVALNNTRTTSRTKALSDPYPTEAEACSNGWASIKSSLTDSWAQNSSVQFQNGSCNVVRNNRVVNTLPIMKWVDFEVTYDIPTVEVLGPNGNYFFQAPFGQAYRPINGAMGTLEKLSTPTGSMWKLTTGTGAVEMYAADGKLISIIDKGVTQSLTYDSVTGLLSQVQDSTGRKLIMAYTNNLLSSVTENNKTTSYSYNASGLITDVKRPDTTHRLYHYEDSRFPKNLTGITDERGIRYASWSYDAQGRGISSEHAGGAEKVTLAFNADGSTTVTNALNKQTIYRSDDVAGARRVVTVEGQATANCAGANQNYTYTPEGWVASKTDWKNNKTTYIYNNKGQEISRTEAYGTPVATTITTEWHATLNVKTKITEPDRETIFNYDANGLLLNQKSRSLAAQ